MFDSRVIRHAGTSLLLLAAAACGDSSESSTKQDVEQPSPTPQIVSFEADPEIVPPGTAATLRWRTRDVVSLVLTDGQGAAVPLDGVAVDQGSVEVTPTETTSYTLTATGAAGAPGPVWRTLTITPAAVDPDAPVIASFTASPGSVAVGDQVTLSWQTTNATRLTLKDDAGVEIDLAGAASDQGQVVVRPTRPHTTYALTATGPGGRANAVASVEVTGLPRVASFYVDPIVPVEPGATVTLYWETIHADHVVIHQGGQELLDTTTELSGSLQVRLDDNATFDIAASANDNTATAQVMAQVGPRIGSFTASDRVVRIGDPIDLAWELADADRAVIDGPGNFHLALTGSDLTSGTATVNLTDRGDFVLQAFRGTVARSASIALEITLAPRVRSLAVDPAIVTASADHPGTVNLSWVQDGAETCTIFRNNVEVAGYVNFACGASGSAQVQVFGDTTLRFVATNAAGSHSATVEVHGIPPATIVAFANLPNRRLTPGSDVQLSWTVDGAVSVSMEKNGAPFSIGASAFTGTATDRVDFDSTYVLTALNSLGYPTVASVDVLAGAPVILSATATPSFAGVGAEVALAWTANGGETLTVTDDGGVELFRTTDPAVIDAGSLPVLVPTVAGTYHYTVTDTNAAGASDVEVVTVVVSDGPMIDSFTANKASLSLGETLTLSWAVRNDPAGNTPTLTLVDNYGNSIDVSAKNPNLGSITFTPAEDGAHTYTLTASTGAGRTAATATTPTVEVSVPPHALSFAATPSTVSTHGGTVVPDVVLSWTSENGVSVSLWEADAAGNVIPPAFYRLALADGATQAQLDAGSTHVHPTESTWYVLRVRNRVGSYVDKRLKVIVDPPEVTSLVVTPAEIVVGAGAQVTWTTASATSVNIDPPQAAPTVTKVAGTFVDVSDTGTSAPIAGDQAVGTITFPAGFTFPFDGVKRTAIQVSTNGWAGFNLANTAYEDSSSSFPADAKRHVNFALFWCDLDSSKNTPAGEVWYGLKQDDGGEFFVVEWKNWSWYSSSYNPSSLNFELVLRPNGLFEFRYGGMAAATAARAAGEGCGIGYQYPASGSYAANIVTYQTAATGGLQNSTFQFASSQPANGSLSLTPSKSTTYTVTAMNADATAYRQADLTVWRTPVINTMRTQPAAPTATQPFQIQWTTTDATRIRVLDDTGAQVCNETDPAKVASGSCSYTAATGGYKTFTLEAFNGPLAAPVANTSRQLSFNVFNLLSLDSFTATPGKFVAAGTPVTLSWTARGATELQLLACVPNTGLSICTDITPAGANPNGGSYTQTMTKSVEFWVRVLDLATRVRESTLAVWVDAPTIDGFSAANSQVGSGASTTLSWTTTGARGAWVSGQPAQAPVLVTASAPFIDLTTSGTPATLAAGDDNAGFYNITFPDNFAFPWFGSAKSALRVSTDGWITFDMGYSSTHATEYTMPTSSSYIGVQIAPFWDDLKRGNGSLLWKQDQLADGTKYLVIEWKNWTFNSSTYNPSDLNFEAVLFESGDIEFRYGTMTAPSAYTSYAAGDSAAMGWQNPDLTAGKMLTNAAGDVVSGGLANKSWRFPLAVAPDSSLVISPTESTTYRVCVTNGSLYLDCRDVRVVVVKPGDILVDELMIAPATDDGEWFEVRNTSPDPIDLAGWQVYSGTEQFTVPATPPVVVQPGGFAVFARSATANGGLTPTVVYGNALTLTDAADEIRLFMNGGIIDGVAWSGTGWSIPAGRSIALEPSVMARANGANDVGANWCPTAAVYGDGTYGGSPGTLGVGCLTGGVNDQYLIDPVAGVPFVDISTGGIDDSGYLNSTYYTAAIPLGFTMPYFGDTVSQMQITKHGYLAFPTQTTYYSTNTGIPATGAPNGFVAPFWDYIYNTTGISLLHHKAVTLGTHQVMIVQWTKVAGGSMSYGTLDFQIQLWDNGDIAFVYRNVNRLNASYDYVYGSSATIGLENNAGTAGIQIFNGSSTTGGGPIYSGRSYLFHRR